MPPPAKRRILFVCTGNTCRSPMAAALFQSMAHKAGLAVDVLSAGIAAWDGDAASPAAQRVLKRHALDLSGHVAKNISGVEIEPGDLVLTMTSSHRDALLKAKPQLSGQAHVLKDYVGAAGDVDVRDPFGGSDAEYEACYERLAELLQLLVDKLAKEQAPPA